MTVPLVPNGSTRRTFARGAASGLAAALGVPSWAAVSESARTVAVLYPDIGEPFRTVFAQVVEGVEDHLPGRVTTLAIGGGSTATEIADELRRREVRVTIALGRSGLAIAATLAPAIGVVIGCVLSAPQHSARSLLVHTLAPDPALLFARMRALQPAVQRVIVVYESAQNAWLIRLAREAARANAIELQALEAQDLQGALRQYQQILATADARRDALWLAQDSTTSDDATVLPLVLKEAWSRGLIVFSSSVTHVKRGALFSLYPNNIELGHALATSAQRLLAGAKAADAVLPLREVRAAVNTRTAAHLGIRIDPRQVVFDLVFPQS